MTNEDMDDDYWFIDSDVMARRAGSDTVIPFSDEELNEHFTAIVARARYEAFGTPPLQRN